MDDALEHFTAAHPREGRVVELKFFGGLEMNEIAEVLDIATKAVSRDWHFAKLWLRRELVENAAHV